MRQHLDVVRPRDREEAERQVDRKAEQASTCPFRMQDQRQAELRQAETYLREFVEERRAA